MASLNTFYNGVSTMKIELLKPSIEMESMVLDFVSEFKRYNEDTING